MKISSTKQNKNFLTFGYLHNSFKKWKPIYMTLKIKALWTYLQR